jgi:hypothetical protein
LFLGEVAKWLGTGLQNRHTPVRIRSSPRNQRSKNQLRRIAVWTGRSPRDRGFSGPLAEWQTQGI